MSFTDYSRYILITIVVFISYLAFLIIEPFIIAVLTAIILAYIFYPIYGRIDKYVRMPSFSAAITTLIIILVITLPLFFVINSITKEAIVLYTLTEQKLSPDKFLNADCQGFLCDKFNAMQSKLKILFYVQEGLANAKDYVTLKSTEWVFGFPRLVIQILITLFITFFLLKDGRTIVAKIRDILTLESKLEKPIMKQFNDVVYSVLYGNAIIAVLEGFLGGLAFFALGITSPILWGAVIGVLAFLPIVGASIVWFPAALILVAKGSLWKGIILVLYGILVIGGIDMVLKPKIIGHRANVHPLVIILGVLGGIALFGFIGFVIGPLIVGLFLTFLELYHKRNG